MDSQIPFKLPNIRYHEKLFRSSQIVSCVDFKTFHRPANVLRRATHVCIFATVIEAGWPCDNPFQANTDKIPIYFNLCDQGCEALNSRQLCVLHCHAWINEQKEQITNLLFGSGTSPHPAWRFIRGVCLNRSEEIWRITTCIVTSCINRREFPVLLAISLAVRAQQRPPILSRWLPVTWICTKSKWSTVE